MKRFDKPFGFKDFLEWGCWKEVFNKSNCLFFDLENSH
ncbi:Uncharacterized protein dnl_10160 [Desulfonema limicola]|uniref:Uncharacterized protein n=1 Tax=Desulfonema limicola TaxID=45656 RepID=A0A975B4S0_9BACT|nr:Uncharacterized protein dnl_10160 [Desulfonema limicola]